MRSPELGKHFSSRNGFLLGFGLLFLLLSGLVNQSLKKPNVVISKQDSAINVNKNLLIFLSAGNKRLFSDLLWIQTLIESDLEHYSNNDLNNWLYLRFSAIQALDPYFYENYLYGGQFLAIIKDDLEAANDLYSKGTTVYPDDYDLNFQAGFINYFEIGDYSKALKYFSKIENNPKSPTFLYSIINKLKYGISQDLEATFLLVFHNYQSTKDNYLKLRLAKDLYAIRAEIDLDCLNKGLQNCRTKDLHGTLYIKNSSGYHAPEAFLKYQIHQRKINPDK